MSCDVHWTAYVSALVLPAVAALAAFIAWQQWRTAQDKLLLELFDRRFAVYQAAKDLLGSIATSGAVKHDELTNFLVASSDARWLLGSDVDKYLCGDLYVKAVHHQTTDWELESAGSVEERQAASRVKAEQRKVLLAQVDVLDVMFEPFLALKHMGVQAPSAYRLFGKHTR